MSQVKHCFCMLLKAILDRNSQENLELKTCFWIIPETRIFPLFSILSIVFYIRFAISSQNDMTRLLCTIPKQHRTPSQPIERIVLFSQPLKSLVTFSKNFAMLSLVVILLKAENKLLDERQK